MNGQTRCGICKIECYSALKRKEILAQATAWMNLEVIMLSELISQSQKHKYYTILLTCSSESGEIHRGRKDSGCQELLLSYTVSALEGGKCWRWVVVMVAQQCGCTYIMPLNYLLTNCQNGKFYVYFIKFLSWKNRILGLIFEPIICFELISVCDVR